MTVNANDSNAPEVEVLATNISSYDEGLEEVTELPFGNDAEKYRSSNQAGSGRVVTTDGIEIAPNPNFRTSIIATTSADRNSWLTYIMSGEKTGQPTPTSESEHDDHHSSFSSLSLASDASASAALTTAAARGETKKTERGFFRAGLWSGVFLLCALIGIGTFFITDTHSLIGIGNSSSISSDAMVYGSKGDKQDDNVCPALLPMSNDCSTTGERETNLSMTYSYFFITDKDDAVDDVISCNEAKVHQALVRDMCQCAKEAQAKSKKIGNQKTKGSRIVVSIESLPKDIADGPCPDAILDQLGDDETCEQVTGGLTLTLALTKALEGNQELTDKEAKKVRKELEILLKNLVKEMNHSLVLGLNKKELKEQQLVVKESVNQLTIEVLQKLISGEYKISVDFTEGDGLTVLFVPATESPSDQPSLSPSESSSPSESLSPSESSSPSESASPSDQPSLSPSESSSPSDQPSLSFSPSESSSPSDQPSLSFSPSESSSPSDQPSNQPSESRGTKIMNLLLSANVTSEDVLENGSTYQGKAFVWVTIDDTISPPLQPGTNDTQIIQRFVLAAFYYANGGDGWTNRNGWLGSETECDWFTVDCSGDVVTKLQTSTKVDLVGSIPTELGKLGSLENLDLGGNDQLTGGIPTELGQLARLKRLYLDGNQLTGGIPTELGELGSLERLYLYVNQLTGGIPTELGELVSLERLWLDENQLTGGIPTELGQLASLKQLHLYENQLTGGIPTELGELVSLERLDLYKNQLTGGIPTELGELVSLEDLYLQENRLTGGIDAGICNLKLQNLIFVVADCTVCDDDATPDNCCSACE